MDATLPIPQISLQLQPIPTQSWDLDLLRQNPAGAALLMQVARQASLPGKRALAGRICRLSTLCRTRLEEWQPHLLGVLGVRALIHQIRQARKADGSLWSPAYQAAHEAALAGILDACWELGLLDYDTLHRMKRWKRAKVARPIHHQARGRYISPEDRQRLWEAASTTAVTPAGKARDRVLVLMLLCGMRREEVLHLELQNLQPDGTLSVWGKGGRERILRLDGWMLEILQEWLAYRGEAHGCILCPVLRDGAVAIRPWSATGLVKRFRALLKQAGLDDITPHDARRTYASDALASGVDVGLVARWMGHADVRTTLSYDRRGLSELSSAGRAILKPCRS